MNVSLKLTLVTLTAIMNFPLATFAAPVDSMSLEVFKDGPQRFWQVSVTCEGLTESRVMLRAVDNDQWCSSEISNLCDENKFSLSRQLCSDDFSQRVTNFKNGKPVSVVIADPVIEINDEVDATSVDEVAAKAPASVASPVSTRGATPNLLVSKEDLLKEQMQIEEQRILIEQKRLELRRKQLELQKRQLNAS